MLKTIDTYLRARFCVSLFFILRGRELGIYLPSQEVRHA